MFFYYREKSKDIVMRSDTKNQTSLPYFEYDPTTDEMKKIEQNYLMFEDKGTIRFEKSPSVLEEDKKTQKEQLKADLKDAKTIGELKTIILTLLNSQ